MKDVIKQVVVVFALISLIFLSFIFSILGQYTLMYNYFSLALSSLLLLYYIFLTLALDRFFKPLQNIGGHNGYYISISFLFFMYFFISVLFTNFYFIFHNLGYKYSGFSDNIQGVDLIFEFFYFSIIIATSLGFGNLHPIDFWPRLAAIAEISLGPIFIIAVVSFIFSPKENLHQT